MESRAAPRLNARGASLGGSRCQQRGCRWPPGWGFAKRPVFSSSVVLCPVHLVTPWYVMSNTITLYHMPHTVFHPALCYITLLC